VGHPPLSVEEFDDGAALGESAPWSFAPKFPRSPFLDSFRLADKPTSDGRIVGLSTITKALHSRLDSPVALALHP
jgi:hypothetical protein